MPVVKIPIQHRFGVISHSQKVKLQENILQELTTQEAHKQNERFNDPVEKCENLVFSIRNLQAKHDDIEAKLEHLQSDNSDFNLPSRASNALNKITEKSTEVDTNSQQNSNNPRNQSAYLNLQRQEIDEALDYQMQAAFRAVERAKRRAGISSNGEGEHVNLTLSWTELAILNRIQDSKLRTECLQALALSMSISPLTSDRIVFAGRLHSLIFVAQSLLFWLDNVIAEDNNSFTIEEFTCLRVLYFIFIRFWAYITLGILNNERHGSQLQNLLKYVQMIDDKTLELYRNYPDAAYCIKVISEVRDELARLTSHDSNKNASNLSPAKSKKTTSHIPVSFQNIETSQAEILDELLIDDVNIHAKLIRDIAPSLYQAIDLFRRFDHQLTPEDWHIFSKTLEMDDQRSSSQFPLMDKLYTIGILGVLAVKDITALNVLQEFVEGKKMDSRNWTENYLSAQSECFIVSHGKTSLIKRSALVTDRRNVDEGTQLCSQAFRPSPTIPNFGGIIDMLNYNFNYKTNTSNTSWIIQAVAISSLVRIEKNIKKDDPLKPAVLNLIQSFVKLGETNALDSRVSDGLILAKAASEIPNSEFINDQNLWNRCAQLFSETLLPNMSIAKTLNQSRVLEVPLRSVQRKSIVRKGDKGKKVCDNVLNLDLSVGKNKPLKGSDYGQKKFNKREDTKLRGVVQDIWDSQLHEELEQQLNLDEK